MRLLTDFSELILISVTTDAIITDVYFILISVTIDTITDVYLILISVATDMSELQSAQALMEAHSRLTCKSFLTHMYVNLISVTADAITHVYLIFIGVTTDVFCGSRSNL